MPSTSPFDNLRQLEHDFAAALAAMLAAQTGLGAYILVLANAAYDHVLWAQLAPALAERHSELAARVSEAQRRGDTLDETDDDMQVFIQLHAIGFERLQNMQRRHADPWTVMFNPLRALRPPRHSGQAYDGLVRAFNASGFHFNKPFLAREIFWQGDLAGRPTRMLYNKFPFARLHGLLVPEPLRELPQYLSEDMHHWAWEVCETAGVPGLCLGYNSQGAGASVNHLHFQSFVQTEPLPVQHARFSHNGGDEPYPLPCQRVADAAESWTQLDHLHQQNQPYNLIYSPGCMHLVARAPQDSPALSAQCRGYGWSEMAGVVTRFSLDEYEAFSAGDFADELASFSVQQQRECWVSGVMKSE
ncbi:MAG: hypothetical protein ABL892_05335 [Thiobacillaceae bacterium]